MLRLSLMLSLLFAGCAKGPATYIMHSLSVPDAQLTYSTRGIGPPVLVVAGGPGFGSQYLEEPLSMVLAEDASLIFYDQRGSGRSTGHRTPARLTMAQFVSDLEAIRRATGHPRITVLGHSFGGLLALHYALAFPERVQALVIIDGDPPQYAEWMTFRQAVRDRRTVEEAQRLEAIEAVSDWQRRPSAVEEYFRVFLRPYFGDPARADDLQFGFTEDSFEKLQATAAAVRGDLDEWDLSPRLQSITAPTLLIYGDRSVFPVSAAEGLAAALPAASLHVLSGVGHFPFLEAPDEVRALVVAFLRELNDSRDPDEQ